MTQSTEIILGMPHLNRNGLDEIWLLKTLGDIHWKMLDDEHPVDQQRHFYASFFNISIKFNTDQSKFREFEPLHICSSIERISDKIYQSTHILNDMSVITICSMFIKISESGVVSKYSPSKGVFTDKDSYDRIIKNFQDKKRSMKYDNHSLNQIQLPFAQLFNYVNILYFPHYLYIVYQSEAMTRGVSQSPIKSIDISYFKNMSIDDCVEAYTDGTVTKIFVNHNPMCICEILR